METGELTLTGKTGLGYSAKAAVETHGRPSHPLAAVPTDRSVR